MDIYTVSDNRHDLPRNIQRLLRVRRDLCRSTDFTSTFLSLHATPETDLFIQDELPDDLHPAVVARQITIELIRDLVKLPQPGPRDRREVVVLVVQTDVIGEEVERSVVRVGLGKWDLVGGVRRVLFWLLENVVFGDEVACDRVQGAGEEGAQDEVAERLAADVLHEEVVDGKLHEDVEGVDAGERQVVDHHWAECVEEDLEGREEGFAGD